MNKIHRGDKMIKKLLIFLIIITLNIVPIYGLGDNAGAMILIDQSGQVLEQNNAHEQLYPASTTKIMTMILLFEAIHDHKTTFDTIVTTSNYASSMGGSQVYLETGEQMSVYDLFKSIAIASANDASVVIGEHVGGTIEQFVTMMNEKAQELGLENTHFTNATGLHDNNHYTSAYDLAIMAAYLIEIGGEDLLEVTSLYDSYIREDNVQPFWLVNTNKLLKTYNVDGLKTGYTGEAGYCLVSTIEKNGTRLIGVLLKELLPEQRNEEMIQLLDYGFTNYTKELIYKENEVIETKQIESHSVNSIEVYSKEDVFMYNSNLYPMSISTKIIYNDDLSNIYTDIPIGILEIYEQDICIKSIPVYSKQEVLEENYLIRLWNSFRYLWN